MRAEGDCPKCNSTLGVKVDDAVATLMSDTIKRLVDKDGNKMRCPVCNQYVDPDDVTVHED